MMESTTFVIISAACNFILGGTTIWSIIKWLGERKLRRYELKEKQTSVEVQRFEALTQQIDYQRQLIAEYIANEQARDELDDKQREVLVGLKRNATKIEMEKIELERQLAFERTRSCLRQDCALRLREEEK